MNEQETKQTTTTEVKAEQSTANNTPENINQFLMEQIKELQEQLRTRDQRMEEITKALETQKEAEPAKIEQDTLSSVYGDIELRTKQDFTWEEANKEFNRRINLIREHKGRSSEEFYWGKQPTDLWAAEYLHSKGLISNLEDFYRHRTNAAKVLSNGI